MSSSPVYKDEAWAEGFWREDRELLQHQSVPYEPFRLWGSPEWHGQFENNDVTPYGTIRRTINPIRSGCASNNIQRIWFFGGSTAWGIGTPDLDTIPSYLSRLLNVDSQHCFEVTNFGVIGYVMNQEVIFLMQELKSGRRPDIVIFYDGVNDAIVGTLHPGIATAHDGYEQIHARLEQKGLSLESLGKRSYALRLTRGIFRHFGGTAVLSIRSDLSAKVKETLDNYDGNIKIVQGLASGYRFKAYFFWQPELLSGNKPMVPFERKMHDHPTLITTVDTGSAEDRWILRSQQSVYMEAERRARATEDFVYLGSVFDNVQAPIYSDWMHLGPGGNERIAEAIGEKLRADEVVK